MKICSILQNFSTETFLMKRGKNSYLFWNVKDHCALILSFLCFIVWLFQAFDQKCPIFCLLHVKKGVMEGIFSIQIVHGFRTVFRLNIKWIFFCKKSIIDAHIFPKSRLNYTFHFSFSISYFAFTCCEPLFLRFLTDRKTCRRSSIGTIFFAHTILVFW